MLEHSTYREPLLAITLDAINEIKVYLDLVPKDVLQQLTDMI